MDWRWIRYRRRGRPDSSIVRRSLVVLVADSDQTRIFDERTRHALRDRSSSRSVLCTGTRRRLRSTGKLDRGSDDSSATASERGCFQSLREQGCSCTTALDDGWRERTGRIAFGGSTEIAARYRHGDGGGRRFVRGLDRLATETTLPPRPLHSSPSTFESPIQRRSPFYSSTHHVECPPPFSTRRFSRLALPFVRSARLPFQSRRNNHDASRIARSRQSECTQSTRSSELVRRGRAEAEREWSVAGRERGDEQSRSGVSNCRS